MAAVAVQGALTDPATTQGGPGSAPRTVFIDHPDVGTLTLLYVFDDLDAGDLADCDVADDAVTDEHGRQAELTYGVVCRGRVMGQIAADALRSVRELAVASYRRFLTSEETFNVESSAGFALEGVH